MNFVILFGFLGVVVACTTKNNYNYNVYDCSEPQIQALGEFILTKLKGTRTIDSTSCYEDSQRYLRIAPFASRDKDFNAKRLAATWVYKAIHAPEKVFSGPLETIDALEKSNTWNILVDRKLIVQRYVLRNSTDGSYGIYYLTEEKLMQKMSNEQYWDHLDMIECENILYYLSKEFGNQLVSFTIVDKENSNDELRFILRSSGIGGFYKPDETTKDDDIE